MADNTDDLIIVRDGEGRFYAFTPEQWAEARVPEDVQAALTELFDGDDTRGLIDPELAEMQSLRLQMVMDRRGKSIEMLTNLMKGLSNQQNAILGNLKG